MVTASIDHIKKALFQKVCEASLLPISRVLKKKKIRNEADSSAHNSFFAKERQCEPSVKLISVTKQKSDIQKKTILLKSSWFLLFQK